FFDLDYISLVSLGPLVAKARRLRWSDNSTARRCTGAMWRCPSRKGAVNEPASPSDDRRYANPQPDAKHAACVCRAGRPVRLLFSQIARAGEFATEGRSKSPPEAGRNRHPVAGGPEPWAR